MDHETTWLTLLPFYHFWQQSLNQILGKSIHGAPCQAEALLASLLVMIVLLCCGWVMRRHLQARPLTQQVLPSNQLNLRNVLEMGLEALHSEMSKLLGKDTPRYFPMLATMGFYILTANLWGLLPGLSAPTSVFSTAFTCGLLTFGYYHFHGIRVHGWGHLAHMANPSGNLPGWLLSPLFLPIEIFSHLARPFTLGIRLFVNISSDHTVLASFFGIIPILLPLPFMALGLLVAVVQTMVFLLLTMVYLQLATAHHDDH